MLALLCFALAVLASLFESRSRLEAENAALRHQLIVLRRKVPGGVRLTNGIAGALSSCIDHFLGSAGPYDHPSQDARPRGGWPQIAEWRIPSGSVVSLLPHNCDVNSSNDIQTTRLRLLGRET